MDLARRHAVVVAAVYSRDGPERHWNSAYNSSVAAATDELTGRGFFSLGQPHMYEINPALDYVQRAPNQLVFHGPAGGFTIHDKIGLIRSALDCIKSGEPLDEAFRMIASQSDRDTAKQHVLGLLEARGIIRKRENCSHVDTDRLQSWLRFVGRNKHAEPIIALPGSGVLRDHIAMELADLGIEHRLEGSPVDCDLGVFCQDTADDTALRSANQKFVAQGIPFLPVLVDRHIISTGPLVIPGATACAECAFHRRQMNSDLDDNQIASQENAASMFALKLAAMFAVEEALRFVFGASYDLHIAKQTRHSLITGRRKHSTILKVPRCPVCRPPMLRDRPLTDTFDRTSGAVGAMAK